MNFRGSLWVCLSETITNIVLGALPPKQWILWAQEHNLCWQSDDWFCWTSLQGPCCVLHIPWPLVWNAVNQLPVKSPSFTLNVSQEVISFCPTEFRVSPEEWASIFAKLTLQVLFHQDRLKKGDLNCSQITESALCGTLMQFVALCLS